MKILKNKKKKTSIKTKFIFYALFFIIPIIIIIFIGNFYAIRLVRKEAFSTNKATVRLYSNQIDTILEEIDFGLLNTVSKSHEFQSFEKNADDLEMTLQYYSLNSVINQVADQYPTSDALFIYEPVSDTFIYSWNTVTAYRNHDSIRDFITLNLPKTDSVFPSTWSSCKINNDFYLFRIFRFNNIYVGAFVNTNTIISSLDDVDESGFAHLLFRSSSGQTLSNVSEEENISLEGDIDSYFLTGNDNQYMAIGNCCKSGDFDIFSLIYDSEVLSGQTFLYKVLLLCIFISCLLLALFISLMQKTMINPLIRLSSAISKLSTGEQNVYLEPINDIAEFDMVYDTFNKMVNEIQQLKIDVYEERISKQKAQLEFYQIQVKPHFFINAINTIYNFAQMDQSNMVMKMSLCIINHFRHTLQNGPMTTLGQELEFTRNYLEMQEIRSSYRLTYHMDSDVPPRILEEKVPTLVIQTFVDNSIKHTNTRKRYISVNVKAELVYTPDKTYVKITISDTGDGFTPEILEKLRKGERITDDRGTHIGIYNVIQRLNLIYKEDSTILFSNNISSGACVEILFPLSHIEPEDPSDIVE